jgi:hypothetical protein
MKYLNKWVHFLIKLRNIKEMYSVSWMLNPVGTIKKGTYLKVEIK